MLPSYLRLLLLLGGSSARLRRLRTVEGATAATGINPGRVERATNDVVANARQVLHPTTTNENNRVLLQIVAFTRNVGGDFHAVGQTNARNLSKRRVRLLWRSRLDLSADAALLGRA